MRFGCRRRVDRRIGGVSLSKVVVAQVRAVRLRNASLKFAASARSGVGMIRALREIALRSHGFAARYGIHLVAVRIVDVPGVEWG